MIVPLNMCFYLACLWSCLRASLLNLGVIPISRTADPAEQGLRHSWLSGMRASLKSAMGGGASTFLPGPQPQHMTSGHLWLGSHQLGLFGIFLWLFVCLTSMWFSAIWGDTYSNSSISQIHNLKLRTSTLGLPREKSSPAPLAFYLLIYIHIWGICFYHSSLFPFCPFPYCSHPVWHIAAVTLPKSRLHRVGD